MTVAPDQSARLYDFCLRYFTHVGATMFSAPPGVLCAQLPRDIDKELTDRPFYWMWVEAMKETPPNTVLYLKFHPDAPELAVPDGAKPELITPGCYRLMRILASAKNRGSFAVGYEDAPCVTPFAVFSVKVSYVCDVRQDFLESYAVDLRDLRVYPDAMKHLELRQIQDERPKATQIAPVPYDLDALFTLVEDRVNADIGRRDQTWAREAEHRLADELARLDAYYSSLEQDVPTDRKQPAPSSANPAPDRRREIDGVAGGGGDAFAGAVHGALGGAVGGAAGAAVHEAIGDTGQAGPSDAAFEGPRETAETVETAETPETAETVREEAFSRAAERELRRAEIVWRTEPKIAIRPTQFALVYLSRPPTAD